MILFKGVKYKLSVCLEEEGTGKKSQWYNKVTTHESPDVLTKKMVDNLMENYFNK